MLVEGIFYRTLNKYYKHEFRGASGLKNLTLIGVDIGSYNISISTGEIDSIGDLHIIDSCSRKSDGITEGLIEDKEKLADVLKPMLDSITKDKENSIISVGITGRETRVAYNHSEISIKNRVISSSDINKLIKEGRDLLVTGKDEIIIDTIILDYLIDNRSIKADIIGWKGKKVQANLCHVIGKKYITDDYYDIFNNLGYNVHKLVPDIVASRKFFLENSFGDTALIDIGNDITDIGIYCNDIPGEIFSIPVGGKEITDGISKSFNLPKGESQKLKEIYSSGYKTLEGIEEDFNSRIGTVSIDRKQLTEVIDKEIEKILKIVTLLLKKASCYDKIGSIILYGDGIVNFEEIKRTASSIFDKKITVIAKNAYNLQNSSTILSLSIVKDTYDELKLLYKNVDLKEHKKDNIYNNNNNIFKLKNILKGFF